MSEPVNDIEIKNEEPIKPYRFYTYDIHDTTYAKTLVESFQNIDKKMQTDFNSFTDNLMLDKQIRRPYLLHAIDDFKKTDNYKKNVIDYHWRNFIDLAFNCRPEQGCSIM